MKAPINVEALPPSILASSRCLVWRIKQRDGKATKVPYCPREPERRASVTDSTTWDSFDAALDVVNGGRANGVGIVLGEGLVGVDLDHCRDATTGEIESRALDIITVLDSYTEVSPSGTGVHVLLHGTLPPGRRKQGPVEMYADGRYFTITGDHLPGTPTTINERTDALCNIHARVFTPRAVAPPPRQPHVPADLDDIALIGRACHAANGPKFGALWRGDTSGYLSSSEADQALCSLLAFWTGCDAVRMDRLFRLSGLYREKWDEPRGTEAYGERTITTAIHFCRDIYTPLPQHLDGCTQDQQQHLHGDGDAGATEGQGTSALKDTWPKLLSPAAYHGVLGDIVRAIEPETEADPAAILVQMLVMFGSIIGRHAHFRVGADRHHLNLFACIVGDTSKGRKGVSHGQATAIFETIDPDWLTSCRASGLSSGEGLIWAVRDAIEKQVAIKEGGRVIDYQVVVEDPGISDKRLLVTESEFASTLKVMGREGNTLSPTIRQAWDGHDLRVITKSSPARATAPHISIIAMITRTELLRYLGATESANGFANRLLWVCSRRSKELPDGGREVDLDHLGRRLQAVVDHARGGGELRRDEAANQFWHRIYGSLSAGRPGLLGAVTSRAEAQVMRLACLYALGDMSYVVRLEHLRAALEVWRYCFDSARHLFGDRRRDVVADEILRELRARHPESITRSAITRGIFARNKPAEEINRALELLKQRKLITCKEDASGGGRPVEQWYATSKGDDINDINDISPARPDGEGADGPVDGGSVVNVVNVVGQEAPDVGRVR